MTHDCVYNYITFFLCIFSLDAYALLSFAEQRTFHVTYLFIPTSSFDMIRLSPEQYQIAIHTHTHTDTPLEEIPLWNLFDDSHLLRYTTQISTKTHTQTKVFTLASSRLVVSLSQNGYRINAERDAFVLEDWFQIVGCRFRFHPLFFFPFFFFL
jgi:hypothetical protein